MKCLVVGATGLVGKAVCDGLAELMQSGHKMEVEAWVRSNSEELPASVRQREIFFEDISSVAKQSRFDVVFCCLGTTMATAGSRKKFKEVDYFYPLALAQVVATWKAHFLIISAVDSSENSPFFYSRVKGELEKQLRCLSLDRLSIFKPSLLLGDRGESRPGEFVAGRVMPLMDWVLPGSLKRFRSINAEVVGRAMVARALDPKVELPVREKAGVSYSSVDICEWDAMQLLAARFENMIDEVGVK